MSNRIRHQDEDDDEADQALADAAIASLDFNQLEERRKALVAQNVFEPSINTKDPNSSSTDENDLVEDKDIPSCDACGKEWSGKFCCTRCRCTFYCSKECQRNHWRGGHKAACDNLQESSQRTAKQVVERLSQPETAVVSMDPYELNRLDAMGPFQAAVEAGLHQAMQGAFRSETDANVLIERRLRDWSTPQNCSGIYALTSTVSCSMFRGERVEGRGTKSSGFGCVDAYRIKRYLQSDPGHALDAWFEASLANFCVPINPQIHRSPHHHLAQRAARDIWAAWLLVMANPRAARAVLQQGQPRKTVTPETVKTSVQAMIRKIKPVMAKCHGADPESDPGGTLAGSLYQFVAMLEFHCKEMFAIKLDAPKMLKLSKKQRVLYITATRLGVATIRKGRFLNGAETQVALQQRVH